MSEYENVGLNTLLERVKLYVQNGFKTNIVKGYVYAEARISLGRIREEEKPLIEKIVSETPVLRDVSALIEAGELNLQRLYNLEKSVESLLQEQRELKKLLYKLVDGGFVKTGEKSPGELASTRRETSLPVRQDPVSIDPPAGSTLKNDPNPSSHSSPVTFNDLPEILKSMLFVYAGHGVRKRKYITLLENGFKIEPETAESLKSGGKRSILEAILCEKLRGVDCRIDNKLDYKLFTIMEEKVLKGEDFVYYSELLHLVDAFKPAGIEKVNVVQESYPSIVYYKRLPLNVQNALSVMEDHYWINAWDTECALTGWMASRLATSSNPVKYIEDVCRNVFSEHGSQEVNTCITTLTLLYGKLKEKYSIEELRGKGKEVNGMVEKNPITVAYSEILEKLNMAEASDLTQYAKPSISA